MSLCIIYTIIGKYLDLHPIYIGMSWFLMFVCCLPRMGTRVWALCIAPGRWCSICKHTTAECRHFAWEAWQLFGFAATLFPAPCLKFEESGEPDLIFQIWILGFCPTTVTTDWYLTFLILPLWYHISSIKQSVDLHTMCANATIYFCFVSHYSTIQDTPRHELNHASEPVYRAFNQLTPAKLAFQVKLSEAA